jgi:hypothetical protein
MNAQKSNEKADWKQRGQCAGPVAKAIAAGKHPQNSPIERLLVHYPPRCAAVGRGCGQLYFPAAKALYLPDISADRASPW